MALTATKRGNKGKEKKDTRAKATRKPNKRRTRDWDGDYVRECAAEWQWVNATMDYGSAPGSVKDIRNPFDSIHGNTAFSSNDVKQEEQENGNDMRNASKWMGTADVQTKRKATSFDFDDDGEDGKENERGVKKRKMY